MEVTANIALKPKKTRSIQRFHPWIFSGAIAFIDGEPENGDFVKVTDTKGKVLGHGFFTPDASIAVRMTHFGKEKVVDRWWHERLQRAYNLRNDLGFVANAETTAYRLIHGEGDGFPGLIIDHYDGVLVMQVHAPGMWMIKDELVASFVEIYGDNLKAVYNKSRDTLPNAEAMQVENYYAHGSDSALAKMTAKEYGLEFNIDWEKGQKTGFFIDQRENRKLLGDLSKGKKVLNTFSYTAGFSVFALQAGATLVHSLDSSARALEVGENNVALNSLDDGRHKSIQADAVQYLKQLEEDYDIIVLDPPAFAKHQRARHRAVQGYKRINMQAIKHIKSGGLIFTFSCSQAVDKELFNNTVIASAIEAGRKVRILHQLHQPADHPVNAFHPEGEYLKGLVLRVD